VVRIVPWGIVGDWDITVPPGGAPLTARATTPFASSLGAPTTVTPVGRAQDHNCEVRGPNSNPTAWIYDATEVRAAGGCQVPTGPIGGSWLPAAALLGAAILAVRRRAGRRRAGGV
jgi:hypothetical protein